MGRVKKAFTLVEVLIVVVIIGIVLTVTYQSYEKTVYNQKIDAAEADLRSFSQSFSSYFIDYGGTKLDTALESSVYRERVDEIIDILNRQYLPAEIVYGGLIGTQNGFKCTTKLKKDPWGGLYSIYINTREVTGVPAGTVIVASYGPDGISSYDDYSSGTFGDDVLVVIEPKAS